MLYYILHSLYGALLMAAGMIWQTAWSLGLGFTITSIIEVAVPQAAIVKRFGKSGFKEIALATGFGAISSSCSYAAASTSRALFKKGASFITSLAFLFSATNLVIELGLLLWLLMGWQFTVAEWLGGIVLIAIMAVLVRLTGSKRRIEAARMYGSAPVVAHCHHHGGGSTQTHQHQDHGQHAHDHAMTQANTAKKMTTFKAWQQIGANYFMEWQMLWKDLLIGFVVGGLITAFVPQSAWDVLFLKNASPEVRLFVGALIGPVIAMLTFVCSIGNVPLAAVFWSRGMPFAGVLSFLYADLIVIPLLDVYRKYYGWQMMWYMLFLFFVTMVISGIVMYFPFYWLHAIPVPGRNMRQMIETFSFNYTFYLNLLFGGLTLVFWWLKKKQKVSGAHH
jgi:uncharacterized protein